MILQIVFGHFIAGSVGSLKNHPALNAIRIAGGDRVWAGGRDEDIARRFQQPIEVLGRKGLFRCAGIFRETLGSGSSPVQLVTSNPREFHKA